MRNQANLSPFGLKFGGNRGFYPQNPENIMDFMEIHEKWDFTYFQLKNRRFRDNFAHLGQNYHDLG